MSVLQRSGVSPEWANLPKRKCDNCGTSYRPKRPLRAPREKFGFCKPECNKQFYKYGAAFIQLRHAIEKEVAARTGQLQAEVRELRSLWSETESRYVALSARLDEVAHRAELPVGFPKIERRKANGRNIQSANG